jgi:hypothetical protein
MSGFADNLDDRKKMGTDKTIDDLVRGLQPVQPVRPLSLRLALWSLWSLLVVGGFVLFVGLHRDLQLVMRSARLVLDAGIVAVLAFVASSSALRLSIPGEERKIDRILPLGVLTTWAIVTLAQIVSRVRAEGAAQLIPDDHIACAALVTSLAAVLSVPLTIVLRRAAPLDKWWCGGLAGLAAGATAMVGIELICVHEAPAHIMAWHVAPVATFALLGALLGPRLLSPRGR